MDGEKKGKQVNRRQFFKKAGEATAIGAITAVGLGALANPSGVGKLVQAMADQVPAYGGGEGPNLGGCDYSYLYCSSNYQRNGEGGSCPATFECSNYSCKKPDRFTCNRFECDPTRVGHTCQPASYNVCTTFSCTNPNNYWTPE